MDSKRYQELTKVAQAVLYAWNGGRNFNDAYWATPFGEHILHELELVMFPVVKAEDPPKTQDKVNTVP